MSVGQEHDSGADDPDLIRLNKRSLFTPSASVAVEQHSAVALSQSPTEFKGGTVWNVMVNINGTLKAVGYALLVLFFLMGIMKHYNSMQEIKRPEQALKLFIRFVLAKAAVTWGAGSDDGNVYDCTGHHF